jgi:hypothetical protein
MVTTFRQFSANLYCAGAEEQRCPTGEPPGICYWQRPDARGQLTPLVTADANRSWSVARHSNRRVPQQWQLSGLSRAVTQE